MKKEHIVRKLSEQQMQKCMAQIAAGDMDALKQLYEALYQPVLLFAASFLYDIEAAKDAVQETFIRVYQNAGQYQERSSVKTWIFSIARNLSADILKKPVCEELTGELSGCEDLTKLESTDALSILNHEQQQIMILSVFGGFQINEIADLMMIPAEKAYYYKRTAVEKLKAYYFEDR